MDRWERAMMGGSRRSKTHAVVRRGHIAEDGFDRLGEADLKAPIAITFMDQWGNEE
jgi:ubiquitin-protein ligase E3 C